MTRRWTLRRRLTVWFAVTAGTLAVLIVLVSAVFVNKSVESVLDGLVDEELDEIVARHVGRPLDVEALEASVVDLVEHHPGIDMAWRLYSGDETWMELGNVAMFRDLTLPIVSDQSLAPRPSLRWKIRSIAFAETPGDPAPVEDVRVGLLLDGSAQRATLERFGWTSAVLVLLAAGLAALGGQWFGRHTSRLLAQVAEGARSSGEIVDDPALPEEIREVRQAFDATLRKIREEDQRARLLVAGLAHELRSPIQNLVGETEYALRRERDASEYRASLESLSDDLRDLVPAVDNLVALCAAQEAAASRPERFDLGREVELRMGPERARGARREVVLEVDHEGPLDMSGDRETLLLAVRNLVGNALDWTPERGAVRVFLRGEPGQITVTVDDEGPGIPEAEREAVFELYYRGEREDGRRPGFGLGLALVRKAVAVHGGSAVVETADGGGARFRLVLPREPRVAESA